MADTNSGFGGTRVIAAMLRHESAMAHALAKLDVMPMESAQSIGNTCKPELFAIEGVLRDSLQFETHGAPGEPPLIRALRDTVHLFNPAAASEVFRQGIPAALENNAMVLLTQEVVGNLMLEMQALADVLGPYTLAAQSLLQTASRIQCIADRALRLQLASQDAQAVAQNQQLLSLLAQGLGLPLHAGISAISPHDEWAALGCELGVLMVCTGRIASGLLLPAEQAALSHALLAQARRAPLLVAQWMAEVAALDAMGAPSAGFWNYRLPSWAALAGPAAQGVQTLGMALRAQRKR